MIIVPESLISRLMTRADAFSAVESVFAAMARGEARNFPVVREAINYADALYGFKSGFDRSHLDLGLKSGGYWPGNAAKGLTNHQSTVVLFDAETGRCRAVVGGNLLTALRTAAASAVSVAHLARKDSKVLGIIGAGHQAAFQLRAVAEQRPFERVVAWNRSPEKLEKLASAAQEMSLQFKSVPIERVGAEADVIVTITSSFNAILNDADVRPGTHIACMGTDTRGKKEIDAAIIARAAVFTDEVAQAISIGECQHAVSEGRKSASDIVPLGSVISGSHPGRITEQEITLFDGTGVGLQDLAVASKVVDRAIEERLAIKVDF